MTSGVARRWTAWWLVVLACVPLVLGGCPSAEYPAGLTLHVSRSGNDGWSGRQRQARQGDGPFATLARARDEIRRIKKSSGLPKGGVTVEVGGGLYEMAGPLGLTAEDSGTIEAPVVYRARRGEEVRLAGGRTVPNFEPLTDTAVLGRLAEAARGKVLQADLKALGIEDFGVLATPGNQLELFFDGKPMTLARWPDKGFTRTGELLEIEPHAPYTVERSFVGKFHYEGERPARWAGQKDVWLHGYWFQEWRDVYQRVESVDTEARLITLEQPYYELGYRKGQRFYALNILCELDSPGEWYLDRDSGVLYFWPPALVADQDAIVSTLPTLWTMQNVSHVTLRGFVLEAVREKAVTMRDCTECRIVGCTVRNTGGVGVAISGGTHCEITGCDISHTGSGAVTVSGGDRATLTAAAHRVENNVVRNFGRLMRTRLPAISVHGVGNRVAHNLICDGPYIAIHLQGNDHVIEFNEIRDVCHETRDVGAVYMGRDWTERGVVIRHNSFRDIAGFGPAPANNAVYLDDAASGVTVYGNVFHAVQRGVVIGGGRDNTVENNLFVDCDEALHVDARGLNWMAKHVEGEGIMRRRLGEVPYQRPPWSERYPRLAGILDDDPAAPKGNVVARNVSWGGEWIELIPPARNFLRPEDNLVGEDPLFADAASMDFRLQHDSPAYALGFKRIPMERIGPYEDDRRASWPVPRPYSEASTTKHDPPTTRP